MSHQYDVIICGAGPAGCTAALALGSSGLKIGLIDKEPSPGGKVCGDAIPAYVPKVLNTIDQAYSRAYMDLNPKVNVNTCRIVAPDEKVLDLKYQEYGSICQRSVFDNFLFELVCRLPDVTILRDTRIKDAVIKEDEAVLVSLKNEVMKARLIIGCDGAHSIIRRKLTTGRNDLHHCSSAVRAYFDNVRDIPESTFEMHFLKEYLPGYFWIFPLPDNRANVGLGMPSDVVARKKINLRNELLRITESVPYLRHRFSDAQISGEIKGYLLPLGSHKVTISGTRFMLCGDAASLIDPATGAGIGQAMVSGRYAGWHALKCFENNDFSSGFMKGYDKAVHIKLHNENRSRLLIRELVLNRPHLFNSLAGSALKSKFLKKMILRLLK